VLRTSRDSEVDTWIIKDDRELTRYGGIETDARVTWIRERDGTIAAWGVVDGWRVRWGGDDLLSGRVQLAKSRTLLVAVNPHEENLCNSR